MDRMLVAYKPCGCRTGAMLEPDNPEAVAEFFADTVWAEQIVREEWRESIGVLRCPEHGAAK